MSAARITGLCDYAGHGQMCIRTISHNGEHILVAETPQPDPWLDGETLYDPTSDDWSWADHPHEEHR